MPDEHHNPLGVADALADATLAIAEARDLRSRADGLRTELRAAEVKGREAFHKASLALAADVGEGNAILPYPEIANEWTGPGASGGGSGDSRSRWIALRVVPVDARATERPVLCMVYVSYLGYADDGVGVGTPARWAPAIDRNVAWPGLPSNVDLRATPGAANLHGNALDTFGQALAQLTSDRARRVRGLGGV